jgi:hypothetical protein
LLSITVADKRQLAQRHVAEAADVGLRRRRARR